MHDLLKLPIDDSPLLESQSYEPQTAQFDKAIGETSVNLARTIRESANRYMTRASVWARGTLLSPLPNADDRHLV